MAWEWSHAPEAYQAAHDNLHDLPRNELRTILAEWFVQERFGHKAEPGAYYTMRMQTRGFSNEALADEIWRRAEEQRTCDNGGHDAWVCPHGCHTVPFHRAKRP